MMNAIRLTDYRTEAVTSCLGLIEEAKEKFRMKGRFIFVGTSGLVNLGFICSISDSIEENLAAGAFPKLYIIDNSEHVKRFWCAMKDIFAKSQTFADLYNNILAGERIFTNCCKRGENTTNIRTYFQYIIKTYRTDSLQSEAHIFSYIKHAVLHSTIICADMQRKDYFEYISKANTERLPIYFFASNIIEFLGGVGFQAFKDEGAMDRNLYQHLQARRVGSILSNIQFLKPHCVIHLRTSKKKSEERCIASGWDTTINFKPAPDTIVILDENEVPETLKLLTHDDLIPLLPMPQNRLAHVLSQYRGWLLGSVTAVSAAAVAAKYFTNAQAK